MLFRSLKKAREEGKIAFFSKPEPDNLFTDGQFVPLWIGHLDFLGMVSVQPEHCFLMLLLFL